MTENGVNSLSKLLENGNKKDRPGAASTAFPTLDIANLIRRFQHMPFTRQYIDSARSRNTQSNMVARFSHFNGGAFNE